MKSLWRDADDGDGMPIDPHALADHLCIAAEVRLPVSVAEHENRFVIDGLSRLWFDESSQRRFSDHRFEEIPGDVARPNPICAAEKIAASSFNHLTRDGVQLSDQRVRRELQAGEKRWPQRSSP
ncbi:MAG TPA: hypothetical protein VGX94_17485 [Terriglobia bacterium]|nr:hypothetical protein [Terriglobia bacterium]